MEVIQMRIPDKINEAEKIYEYFTQRFGEARGPVRAKIRIRELLSGVHKNFPGRFFTSKELMSSIDLAFASSENKTNTDNVEAKAFFGAESRFFAYLTGGNIPESHFLPNNVQAQRKQNAKDLIAEYAKLVKKDPSNDAAIKYVYNLLYNPQAQGYKKPFSYDELMGAVINYAASVINRKPQYKFFSATFFGKERIFESYIPDKYKRRKHD
jgi:hypothetical protein